MSSFLFSIFIMFLIIIYLLQAAEIYSLLSAVCVNLVMPFKLCLICEKNVSDLWGWSLGADAMKLIHVCGWKD